MKTSYTFDEFVKYALDKGAPPVANGMPWSFSFFDHPVTHENDNCYLIARGNVTLRFMRGDTLYYDQHSMQWSVLPPSNGITEIVQECRPRMPALAPHVLGALRHALAQKRELLQGRETALAALEKDLAEMRIERDRYHAEVVELEAFLADTLG